MHDGGRRSDGWTRMARDPSAAVAVPPERLTADVLRRLVEEFVTRDGTDYGAVETSLDAKVADVRRQLERGEAAIVYDAESETINIVGEAIMGDRSPKSKQRDQRQKNAAKASDDAAAKQKQDAQSRAPLPGQKGKK